MKAILPLFIFVDACGWEIIRNDTFLQDVAPARKRLDSVFGYSSACVPSILSGRWPDEHRNWCYFVYDPKNSPFKSLRWLRWLPSKITSRRIFRRWLSKFVKVRLSFRGYFDLYNIPFKHIAQYDFTEKKSPLQPGGMNRGPNIFDFLERRKISYHVSAPQRTEIQNLRALISDIKRESIDFAFLYWPALDGLLHSVGNRSPLVPQKLREYENWIRELLAVAGEHYAEARVYIFSDHGMANCDELLDLKAKIEPLPFRMGKDYAVVYDSTMARFWFFNERARQEITATLKTVSQGRILPDSELKEMRAHFPDGYFGELIFLANEGVLIVPSHMGERPIRGMHGYHPLAPQSYAMLCTNQPEIPEDVVGITDIFRLMTHDAELAAARNPSPVLKSYEQPSLAR
ncbi:MAG TPA: alkaline phosphatase family protein [Candidatus Polarisedimenticolia bacterium]|nr:alkaline phosphatase family protein [Candidatus Polarisedimenticolia bacterium]